MNVEHWLLHKWLIRWIFCSDSGEIGVSGAGCMTIPQAIMVSPRTIDAPISQLNRVDSALSFCFQVTIPCLPILVIPIRKCNSPLVPDFW
jgi:hypothetical protein